MPDHQYAYNALGYSLAERNLRLPEARELIHKALELSPGEPFITDSLGWVEYRLGNRDDAIRLLRDAYQSRPDPEIAAHLGEVLWASGKAEEARRVWREGRSRDASNDVPDNAGTACASICDPGAPHRGMACRPGRGRVLLGCAFRAASGPPLAMRSPVVCR